MSVRMPGAEQFYRARQAEWKALADLLARSQSGIERLSPEDIAALGSLYRAATSDLALAQRDFPDHAVTSYLNQLVARAHAVLYRGRPMALRRIGRFLTAGFPRCYRQALPFVLVAALLFLLPALASGVATGIAPQAAGWLLPAEVQDLIPQIEQGQLWTDIPIQERPYASSAVMRNNIQVAFLAFGGGMLLGLPTVWVMVLNGLLLGGLTGLTTHYGIGLDLWTFAIGHGVVELSVVFIAGGSGLMLGWAMIQPGLLNRRDALLVAARRAIRLLVGCLPLLVLAGLIEGFVSPAEAVPAAAKWAVGLGTGVLLYAYLLLAGRETRRP